MLTLGQAAKETDTAKSVISRAIKTGRISANRKANGTYEIDPAELFRVYPRNSGDNPQVEQLATPQEHHEERREIGVLRELIDEIKNERDNLRSERDLLLSVIKEQAAAVKQLTYQPAQQTPAQATAKPPAVRAWLLWLFGVVAIAAIIFQSLAILWLK